MLVRTRVDEVSSLSRNTQGVTLIRLANDETLVGLERVQEPTSVDEEDLGEASEDAANEQAPDLNEDVISDDAQVVADESGNPEE